MSNPADLKSNKIRWLIQRLLAVLSTKPSTLSELEIQTGARTGEIIEALRNLERSKTIIHEWQIKLTESRPQKIKATKKFRFR